MILNIQFIFNFSILLFDYYRLDGKQDEVDCASVSNAAPGTGDGTASATAPTAIVQNPGDN